MAGNFPRFPQRLMVNGDTLKRSAASPTVKRSGKLSSFKFFFSLVGRIVLSSMSDIEVIRWMRLSQGLNLLSLCSRTDE